MRFKHFYRGRCDNPSEVSYKPDKRVLKIVPGINDPFKYYHPSISGPA